MSRHAMVGLVGCKACLVACPDMDRPIQQPEHQLYDPVAITSPFQQWQELDKQATEATCSGIWSLWLAVCRRASLQALLTRLSGSFLLVSGMKLITQQSKC